MQERDCLADSSQGFKPDAKTSNKLRQNGKVNFRLKGGEIHMVLETTRFGRLTIPLRRKPYLKPATTL